MQIDIIWLQDNFRQFNSRYFGGLLPTPTFHIGRSRTQLGSLSYQRGLMWKGPSGGVKNAFTLTLSNFYDQTEFQFRNVLLHEMIHLSIASSGIKDTSAHGVVFRGMMDCFNREGWDIHVRTSMNGTPKASTGSAKVINTYLVLAIEMKDGTHFLSSVNPKFAGVLNSRLPHVRLISRYAWYTTNDRWFEDMPKVRSLRGRKVDAQTFKNKTTTMKALAI